MHAWTKLILVLLLVATVKASEMTVKICAEKDYDCQVMPLQDVKKVEKIVNGEILRITFYNGQQLDITVRNKWYKIDTKK
jgi:hypothetical protein